MSRDDKRKKTGWWLPVLISIILGAAGIRYASSSEWWSNFFGRKEPVNETISSGASVLVSTTTATPETPASVPSPRPNPGTEEPLITQPEPKRRMW